jgi:hypothetical protein
MATLENNNDQNQNMDFDMQLAVTKEKNRHEEEMERINACNSQEDRKITLDEKRVDSDIEEAKVRIKATEAKIAADKDVNDSALAVRKTGMALLGQLVGLAERFFDLKLKQEETRYNFNKAYDAFRLGADVEVNGIKLTHHDTPSPASTDTKTAQGQCPSPK